MNAPAGQADTQALYETAVTLNADDYRKFTLYQGRIQLLTTFLFYICLIVIAVNWRTGEPLYVLASIPIGILVAGGLVYLQVRRIGDRTRKLFNGDKVLQLEHSVRLTEQGIEHRTGSSSLDARWENVYRVVESKDAMLLFLAKNKAIVLPKREIEDIAKLRDALKSRLPSGKLRLRR